jgi:hypothetical protein
LHTVQATSLMAHLHDIALALGKKTLLNKYTFLSNITAISILQLPTRFRYRFDGSFT